MTQLQFLETTYANLMPSHGRHDDVESTPVDHMETLTWPVDAIAFDIFSAEFCLLVIGIDAPRKTGEGAWMLTSIFKRNCLG